MTVYILITPVPAAFINTGVECAGRESRLSVMSVKRKVILLDIAQAGVGVGTMGGLEY